MSTQLFEATDQNFEAEVLNSTVPVLIEFTAEWCAPCKMLAPIMHELADKYAGKMRVGLLDCDIHQGAVQQYNVMGMPTLILYINGEPVERIVGYTPGERIEAKLLPHLSLQNA